MMLVAVIIGLVAMFCCILMTAPRKAPRRRRSYRDAPGSDDRVFFGDHHGSHHGGDGHDGASDHSGDSGPLPVAETMVVQVVTEATSAARQRS